MKSQLLQSCQGCASSTCKPHPSLPQGEGVPPNHLKHNKKELLLLGESWGGTFNKLSHLEKEMGRGFLNGLGGAPNKQLFFYRQRRTFLRPRAAFFTVAAAVVMHGMTVGMVETARRKTRFPTVGTAIHAKAKPTATATAFCDYINLL